MISFENVSKFILEEVSVHIPRGKIVGVIGKPGAGKTTMLKLASGLLLPQIGRICTNNHNPVKERKELCKSMRVYFADIPLFSKEERVVDVLNEIRFIYNIESVLFENERTRLQDLFQITKLLEKRVGELSLGQRRRVELCTLFLGEVEVLVLDEPTIGLDAWAKQALAMELFRKKRTGTTILISSHDMVEMKMLCDRYLLLDEGKIIYYGAMNTLLKTYAPMNSMEIRFRGNIPDMEDIPLVKYSLENDVIRLQYNSNVVSAAEITKHIISQTEVLEISMQTPELGDVIGKERIRENGTFY